MTSASLLKRRATDRVQTPLRDVQVSIVITVSPDSMVWTPTVSSLTVLQLLLSRLVVITCHLPCLLEVTNLTVTCILGRNLARVSLRHPAVTFRVIHPWLHLLPQHMIRELWQCSLT